jgi:DNA-binding NarL/FixJ family response regulator
MTINILLADDHQVVRQGLRALLEAENDFVVVGEVGDGLTAVQEAGKLKPHVLIADIMMPGINGIEVVRQVKHRSPDTKLIVLSMYADESHVFEALQNGASAYVLKGSSADELVHAVREVMAGRRYFSESVAALALEAVYDSNKEREPYNTLTTREREVLHLSAEGHNNTQIAEKLMISPRTVETHRANLMRKLGLQNQTDLVRYAIKRGILSIDL